MGLMVHYEVLDKGSGIRVMDVTPNGPASIAGIEVGDFIVEINGDKLGLANDLEMAQFLSEFKAGDRLRLEILRAGKVKTFEMTCGKMPEARARAQSEWMERANDRIRRGVDISCEEANSGFDETVANEDGPQRLWTQFVRGITGNVELLITRQELGEISLKADKENLIPAGLTIDSLPPDFQKLAEALKPGDSMGIEISFDPFLSKWKITFSDRPGYLDEVLESLRNPNAGSSR